jgi:hypothetical protein
MLETIQKSAVVVLVVSLIILTFLAVFSIWDILDKDVWWKSIATMGVVTFSSLVVIAVTKTLQRHQGPTAGNM